MASHPGNVLLYFFKRFIYVFYVFIWRGAQREREQQTPHFPSREPDAGFWDQDLS